LNRVVHAVVHRQNAADDILILSYDQVVDAKNGYAIFKGGVVAKYGVTTLKTDTLVVRDVEETSSAISVTDGSRTFMLGAKEAHAFGSVELIDPDGTIKAEDLWFTWSQTAKRDPKNVIGRAKGFYMRVGALWMKAETAEQTSLGWNLKKISASTCNLKTPLYEVTAKELNITPGKRGSLRHVRIGLLGQKLPDIPVLSFSLDRRTRSTRLPQLSYRQRDGFGVAWNGNVVVDDSRQYNGFVNAFPKLKPVYSIYYSETKIPAEKAGFAQFIPIDDLGERALYSPYESIYTTRPEDAKGFLNTPRNAVTFGTLFNVGTFGRQSDLVNTYSKPIEAVLEKGGPAFNGWSYLSQVRGMVISEDGGDQYARGTFTTSMMPPLLIKGRLVGSLRIDSGLRVSSQSSGWFGGEIGLSYKAKENLRFSVGAYGFKPFGTTLFNSDRFVSDQGYVFRTDLEGSATKVSLMWRYDPTQGWFDRQMRISQVIGCLEPVFIYRGNPNEYQIGIRFRIDEALALLQQRKVNRDKEPKKPIR
jgi:hypothetical protein